MELYSSLIALLTDGQIFRNKNVGSDKGKGRCYIIVSKTDYQINFIRLFKANQIWKQLKKNPEEFVKVSAIGKMRECRYAYTGKVHSMGITPMCNELKAGRIKLCCECLGYDLVQIYDACSCSNAFSTNERTEFENKAIDLI